MPRRRYASYFDEICKKRMNAPRDRAQAMTVRLNALKETATQSKSPQVVVKIVGWSKGAGAAMRTAKYISRHNDERLDIPLETSSGTVIDTKADLAAELATWNLIPNDENRSSAYQNATINERALMPQNDALARRQSVHMVFSLPSSLIDNKSDLQTAVRETLSDTMGAAGHKYLMAVHDHEGRPHVHVVAQVRGPSDARGRTAQMRIGREEIDVYRLKLAEHLRERGVEVAATRRTDRPELRSQIKQGTAPLHHRRAPWYAGQGGFDALTPKDQEAAKRSYKRWRDTVDTPYSLSNYVDYVQQRNKESSTTWLETAAPKYYSQHGAYSESRRAREPITEQSQRPTTWLGRAKERLGISVKPAPLIDPRKPPTDATPAQQRAYGAQMRLHQAARNLYGDAAAAGVARFSALYRENPRAAVWTINNRPEAFGVVVGPTTVRITGRGFDPTAYPPPARDNPPTPDLRRRAAAATQQRRAARDLANLHRADTATAAAIRETFPLDVTADKIAQTLAPKGDPRPMNRTPTHTRTPPQNPKPNEQKPDRSPNTDARQPDPASANRSLNHPASAAWEQKPQPRTTRPKPTQKPKRPSPDRTR